MIRRDARLQEREESGAALLLTIWTLTLLAVIATVVTADVRAGLRLTSNVSEAARARALAEGGIWAAVSILLGDDGTLILDGAETTLAASGDSVTVSMQDEGGRLDVNHTNETVLAALCTAAGIGGKEGQLLARQIVEQRSRLDAMVNKPRSSPASGAGAVVHAPPLPPFVSLLELRTIAGLSDAHYRRLVPFLTVYGGDWRINPRTASVEVLAALPGMSADKAQQFVALRREKGGSAADLRLAAPADISAHAQWRRPRVVTVRSTAVLPSGARFVREAVVDLAPGPGRPYQMLAWPVVQ